MSLTYKTEAGKIVTRADWGATRQRVLDFLTEHPWSTQNEVGVHNEQLRRMMRRGLLIRRVGSRKNMPYEYALKGEGSHAVQSDERDDNAT